MSPTEAVALQGLSVGQQKRVSEWLKQFSLSSHELAVWGAVRHKFVRSTTYKVPVETKIDEVCRDLFELKQFAQRIVSLLSKVSLEVVAKKTQGAFKVEEIAHWRDSIAAIKLPFRFDTGVPQAELNDLIEDGKKKKVDNKTSPARTTTSATSSRDDLPKTPPSAGPPSETSIPTASTSSIDDSATSTCLPEESTKGCSMNSSSIDDSVESGPTDSAVKVPATGRTRAKRVLIINKVQAPAQGEEIAPQSTESVINDDAERPTDHSPEVERKKPKIVADENSQNAEENAENNSGSGDENVNSQKETSRVEPFAANEFESTFPSQKCDLPTVEVPPCLSKYLAQFRVEPVEFLWWLKQRGDDFSTVTHRLYTVTLAKADEFLVFVSNLLEKVPSDKDAIPSMAQAYGVQAHSLEKWLHYRDLFNQDKTALKLSLFGENALRKMALEDVRILQLEKMSRFKPPAKRLRLPFRSVQLPEGNMPQHEIVTRVMNFYMLSPNILDQLPLPENVGVFDADEFANFTPLQKLLYDLESLIINKCEAATFLDMFPTEVSRICFGSAPMKRSGRLRALYQLSVRDVVSTVTSDNSRLRSKELQLPAYFDTSYDGIQPIVPVGVPCSLVNATHTGSTWRDRQRTKTREKVEELLKKYGSGHVNHVDASSTIIGDNSCGDFLDHEDMNAAEAFSGAPDDQLVLGDTYPSTSIEGEVVVPDSIHDGQSIQSATLFAVHVKQEPLDEAV